MVIKESRPITMAEVSNLVGDSDKSKSMKLFIKNFKVLKFEKAMELKKELEALDLIKLKEDHIVKIVDFLPTDATELNKVLQEVALDQEEVNKILEVVKKY